MKEYILTEPYKIDVREMPIPEPGEGEVLIKISNVGICGSDIHLYNGTYSGPNSYPILFGHEWSGTVVKKGCKVTKVEVGDKVTGDCSRYCGHCVNCKRDKNLCKEIEKFGITIDGASSEYIVRDEKYIYKAPSDINMKLLALTEPIAVARHLIVKMIRQTGALREKKILIYGGGAIGQAALLILKHEFGCDDVYLSDLIPYRMELSEKFGGKKPEPEELKWMYENSYFNMYNKTPFDVVIETTGVAGVFANAINLVRPGGVLGCVGMISSVEIPQKLIVTKAMTIIGSIGGTEEFDDVIRFIHSNEELVKNMVSHEFSCDDIPEAFDHASNPQDAMKVSIVF